MTPPMGEREPYWGTVRCVDKAAKLYLEQDRSGQGLQRHHPHPEHGFVADLDIVFAGEGQLAVGAHAEHREAGGYRLYRIAVAHVYRQIVFGDQEPSGRIDVKGARVDPAGFDVLDRRRLAGRLIDPVDDDAVFAALENLLALKLGRRLGAIGPV